MDVRFQYEIQRNKMFPIAAVFFGGWYWGLQSTFQL